MYPHILFRIDIKKQLLGIFSIFFSFSMIGAITYFIMNLFSSDICQLVIGIVVFVFFWICLSITNNEFNIRNRIIIKQRRQ